MRYAIFVNQRKAALTRVTIRKESIGHYVMDRELSLAKIRFYSYLRLSQFKMVDFTKIVYLVYSYIILDFVVVVCKQLHIENIYYQCCYLIGTISIVSKVQKLN